MQEKQLLNKAECAMMKAIAILMIMAHNFAHLLDGVVTENEYRFDVFRTSAMWHSILQPDGMLLMNFLSFFGHYGVPVFLFLSGYGLVKKYEQGTSAVPGTGSFIARHYVKLLKLMVPGLIIYFAVVYCKYHTFQTTWTNVVAQLGMYINLLSEPWFRIKPGPYWFFGLMLQLYIIYRLLLHAPAAARNRRWLGPVVFLVVCQLIQYLSPRYDMLYWVRYNFFVAGLPFALGLLMARYDREIQLKRWMWLAIAAVVSIMVLPMNLRFTIWLWAAAAVVVAAIALVKALPECFHKPLLWIGQLSSALFVVHPIVRALLLDYAKEGHPYLFLTVYIIVSILIVLPYRWLINRIKI